MNLLVSKPLDYINVEGLKLNIKTDFSIWVGFLIAVDKKDNKKILAALGEIFETIPSETDPVQLIQAMKGWISQSGPDVQDNKGEKISSSRAFDFDVDGNVIYCELWEYFPHLMERGITYHEGIELIKLLIANDNTILHHRAFARCGDFSKMDKEQKKYWNRERARYAIKASQADIDDIFSRAF